MQSIQKMLKKRDKIKSRWRQKAAEKAEKLSTTRKTK